MWLLWTPAAWGQVNAEVLVARASTPGPAAGIKGSAGLSTGNVNSLWWRGEGVVQYLSMHPDPPPEGAAPYFEHRAMLFASAVRSSYDGEPAEDSGLAHARYTWMAVPRFGPEAFAQLQFDRFLLLQRRLLVGGGVRVDLVHRKEIGVWGGTGVMWEDESLSDGTGTWAIRSTTNGTVRVVIDGLTLTNTAYFQPRVDEPADYRFLEEARIEAKASTWVTLGVELIVRHDSRPPDEVLPTDVKLGSTLAVQIPRPKPPS
jgi:hypothetical protein